MFRNSMNEPVSINASQFVGLRGHSYQVYVEAYHSNGSLRWSLGWQYASHYSNNAYAPATTVYGRAVASMPGSPYTACYLG
jgi:hypothetical protein